MVMAKEKKFNSVNRGRNDGKKWKPKSMIQKKVNRNGKKKFGNNSSKVSSHSKKNIHKDKAKLIIQINGRKWYEVVKDCSNETTSSPAPKTPEVNQKIQEIKNSAKNLMLKDTETYRLELKKNDKKGDFIWMEKMMKTGTLKDKMAAHTVRIIESPVHNLSTLKNLVSMVKIQGKQLCLEASESVKDLFLEDLLPPDRKLIRFEDRTISVLSQCSDEEKIIFAFEDELRIEFLNFVNSLRKMSSDAVDKMRSKAISISSNLLTSHPEQEQALLDIIVNKLGDPVKKVASKALFHLKQLLDEHPRMKTVVVQEIERLLFRNNVSKRAQYYGVCFLNSINLSDEHPSLGTKMTKIYLAFFKACIKTGEIQTKIMSGLLTGINRSFRLAQKHGFEFGENVATLFKIVQISSFNIAIQALSVIYLVTDVKNNPSLADRYYRALYKIILSQEFSRTALILQLMNLLYKSLKADSNINRLLSFIKRLLQCALHSPANIACSILFLVSEISKKHKALIRLEKSSKPEHDSTDFNSETDDYPKPQSENSVEEAQVIKELIEKSNIKVSAEEQISKQHVNPTKKVATTKIKIENFQCRVTSYDPLARNPSYSGAHMSLLYELIPFTLHSHPSVAIFAQTILRKETIAYDGNPLKDFTFSKFLERFVYKNPKKNDQKNKYQPHGLRNVPVNSKEYLETEESKIPQEELFFYRYFQDKLAREEQSTKTRKENEEIDDEEFDEIINNYFGGKKRKNMEEGDEDVDFTEVSKTKNSKKNMMMEESDAESEVGDDSDQESPNSSDDVDEFEEIDDEEGPEMVQVTPPKLKKFKKSKDDVFVPAEEFDEILESNLEEAFTDAHTFVNKDRASLKQLQWEANREQKMKGYRRTKKRPGNLKRKRNK